MVIAALGRKGPSERLASHVEAAMHCVKARDTDFEQQCVPQQRHMDTVEHLHLPVKPNTMKMHRGCKNNLHLTSLPAR